MKNKIITLISLLIIVILMSATLGASDITFIECIKIILSKIPLINMFIDEEPIKYTHKIIVLNIRMPRIILASFVGCGLSIVGATFQSLFRNPMADPYVIGISSGAAFGATLAMVLGLESYVLGVGIVSSFAFIFSLITAFFVYNISRVGNRVPTNNILLSGIAVSLFMSSFVSIMMIFNKDKLEKIVFWTMGSFSAASWQQVMLIIPVVIIGTIIIIVNSRKLNIISLGEESAETLGVDIEGIKKLMIIVSSMIIGTSVAFTGIIGFVGLIVPHIVRSFVGGDNKKVLILASLTGAIFLVLCDTIARSIVPPTEIPIGAITAFFGTPFFIYLLRKNNRREV